MNLQYSLRIAFILLACAFWIHTWNWVSKNDPHAIATNSQLMVDSDAVLNGSVEMIKSNNIIFTPDVYHSVGMQVLFSAWTRVWDAQAVLRFKQLNVILYGLAVLLAAWLCFKITSNMTGAALTAALVASSTSLREFTGTLQYEVLTSLILLGIVILSRHETKIAGVFLGACVFLLSTIRAHFTLIIPIYFLLDRMITRHRIRDGLWPAASFLALALPWNAFYSLKLGHLFWFQGDVELQIHRFLHPAATGRNFPFESGLPPTGFAFIIERPQDYLSLLGRRALYLFGWQPDTWHVSSTWARLCNSNCFFSRLTIDRLVSVMGGSLAAIGWIFSGTLRERTTIATALITIIAPHFIISSSFRFLIPMIPLFSVLQAVAVYSLVKKGRNVFQ